MVPGTLVVVLQLQKYIYSHGQELFYKFVSKITNKLVKQLLSMTVLGKLLFCNILN